MVCRTLLQCPLLRVACRTLSYVECVCICVCACVCVQDWPAVCMTRCFVSFTHVTSARDMVHELCQILSKACPLYPSVLKIVLICDGLSEFSEPTTRSHTCTRSHTHTHIHTRAHMHTHLHTYTRTHMQTCYVYLQMPDCQAVKDKHPPFQHVCLNDLCFVHLFVSCCTQRMSVLVHRCIQHTCLLHAHWRVLMLLLWGVSLCCFHAQYA